MAGILDGYQFSPQGYGGQGGGLLDVFRMMQAAPMQQPQGFAPEPSALPPQAQLAQAPQPQAVQPQAPQPQQPNHFGAGLNSFVGNLHNGPIAALLGGAVGLAGMPMTSADTRQGSDDIREYEYARRQGFKGGLADWMAQKRGGAGERGLNPIYGTNEKGETVLIQPTKTGPAHQMELPPGFKVSTGVEKINLGDRYAVYDKRSGEFRGYEPINNAAKERDQEIGKSQGQASQMLPQVETTVKNASTVINNLRNHPGLDIGTGLSSKADPRSWIPGQPGYDFIEMNKTAQGQSFMAARESLKGAGQVTDFEGEEGRKAITNLNTAQSKEQYLAALDTLERMMNASLADLKRKAGQSVAPNAPASSRADPLGIR